MAHRFLPAFALDYLEGGAEEEQTLQARNLASLAAWRFLPHALQDVAQRSLETRLFDEPMPLPLVIAPTGLNGLFRAGADRMLAEAAAAAGIPFTQSTMSNMAVGEGRGRARPAPTGGSYTSSAHPRSGRRWSRAPSRGGLRGAGGNHRRTDLRRPHLGQPPLHPSNTSKAT